MLALCFTGGFVSTYICLRIFGEKGQIWCEVVMQMVREGIGRGPTWEYSAHRPSWLCGSRCVGRGWAGPGTSCCWHLCCRGWWRVPNHYNIPSLAFVKKASSFYSSLSHPETQKTFPLPSNLRHLFQKYIERRRKKKGGGTYNSCPVSSQNTYAPSFS